MATLWTKSASVGSRITHSPGKIRASINSHNSKCRAFSSSPRYRIDTVDVITVIPKLVLTGLHEFGIPWYATIPLTAVIFRGIVGYPIEKSNHERSRLRAVVQPMFNAKYGGKPGLVKSLEDQYVRYGTAPINLKYITQVGILLACAEAVRTKAGASKGLLGIMGDMLGPLRDFYTKIDPTVDPGMKIIRTAAATEANATAASTQGADSTITTESLSPGTATVANTNAASIEGAESTIATDSLSTDALHAPDPTMTTEGFSWCTDLTVADPTGFLPNLLLVAMCLNIIIRPSRASARNLVEWLYTFNSIDFVLFTLACYIRLAGDIFPAALLLYFLSSIVVGRLNKIWLHYRTPIPAPVIAQMRAMAPTDQPFKL